MENDLQSTGSGLKRELGLAAAVAIVVGNMIGSGIFMAPQNLAAASNPKTSIIAWIITAIGSVLVALSFANLGTKMPKTGGPIVYAQKAFGEFAGFLVAWTYWTGAWIGNAAIITGFMSYLTYFVPALNNNRLLAFVVSSLILWVFTWINIKGVKEAGIVGIVTTVLKIIPLIVFAVIAAIHFNPGNLHTVSSSSVKGMSTLPSAIAITLWAFVGLECATVSADEIKNPEKNIRRSTLYGTIITAGIYILISILAMGGMAQGQLSKSSAPLPDIINHLVGGNWGGTLIAVGAIISTLGGTSGWILTTARSAYAPGKSKLFPAAFAKLHKKYKTPHVALIVSAICTNLLLIMNYTGSLTSAYGIMLLLGTLSSLPAYSFTAASEIVLLRNNSKEFNFWNFIKSSFFALLAFGYAIYAIYGSGSQAAMFGFMLMLVGLPFYAYMKLQNRKNGEIDIEEVA